MENEKVVIIEVWNGEDQKGFRSSLNATEKLSKVYNDSVFGGISWSRDSKKIVFIGEGAEIKYKPFFKDAEEPEKLGKANGASEKAE